MVEITPISNPYPQVPYHPDHNQGSFTRSHEWNKLIAVKKSVMELILDQCDKVIRAEITLGQSPEYDVTAGGILKFITEMRKVCTNSKRKDVFFGSSITRITEHYIWPATRAKELLAAHPDDNSIWNNTDPCDVSLDNTSDTKSPVSDVLLEDTSYTECPVSIAVRKEPVKITTTPMSIKLTTTSTWHKIQPP